MPEENAIDMFCSNPICGIYTGKPKGYCSPTCEEAHLEQMTHEVEITENLAYFAMTTGLPAELLVTSVGDLDVLGPSYLKS